MARTGASKLWLVSRRLPELERVQKECVEIAKKAGHTCDVVVRQLDLAEESNCLIFAKTFGERVDILVNNGGIS